MKVANDFHPLFFCRLLLEDLQFIHIWINLLEYGSSIIRKLREERGRFKDAAGYSNITVESTVMQYHLSFPEKDLIKILLVDQDGDGKLSDEELSNSTAITPLHILNMAMT